MNIDVDNDEEHFFCIEDIVSYSNIEITHVNDNKAPMKVVATKIIVCALIIALVVSLFFV